MASLLDLLDNQELPPRKSSLSPQHQDQEQEQQDEKHLQEEITHAPPMFGLIEPHWWDGIAFSVVHQKAGAGASQNPQQQQSMTGSGSFIHDDAQQNSNNNNNNGGNFAVLAPMTSKSFWEKQQQRARTHIYVKRMGAHKNIDPPMSTNVHQLFLKFSM